jgi:hypothetical protein
VLQIEFKMGNDTYNLDATCFGCDIFMNKSHLDTIHGDGDGLTEGHWIGKAVEYIVNQDTSPAQPDVLTLKNHAERYGNT